MPVSNEYVSLRSYYSDGTVSQPRTKVIRMINDSDRGTSRRVKPKVLSVQNGTSLSRSRQRIYDSIVTWHQKPVQGYVTTSSMETVTSEHFALGQGSDPLRYTTSLDTIVINKLRAAARQRSVNLGNMLGEYKQAANLFEDMANRVYRLTLAARSRDPRILIYGYLNRGGRFRKGTTGYSWAVSLQRDIAAWWLEYVYGVVPLMSDMHDAMVELKKPIDRGIPNMKVRASKTETGDFGPPKTFSSTLLGSAVKGIYQEFSKKTVSGVAEVAVRNDILNSALGAYGFTNPVGIAWELTPYSFIIDWWVNVGEVLESLDNALYFDGNSTWYQLSTRYSYRRTVEVLGGGGLYTNDTYGRTSPGSLGTIADFRFKSNISGMHVANGIALLRAALKG